jgi:cytochrome o ubiquinol oxidase subunit 1
MPKNTIVPLVIASLAFALGFGMIWHMYWLSAASLLGIIACIIVRASSDDNEYVIPAAKVRENEELLAGRYA